VPEVLYHWRRHAGSSTNTDRPESAQQDSVKAMFTRMAADTGHPERYEVTEFPLWRGATEFHLRRQHVDAPSVALVSLGSMSDATRSSVSGISSLPLELAVEGPTISSSVDALVSRLDDLDTDLVWILDSSTILDGPDPIWDILKWFELLGDVGAVCGRSVAADGLIASGAGIDDPDSRLGILEPLAGRALQDPGPYALALKPHTIDFVDIRCTVADRSRLLQALDELPASTPIDGSGLLIARSLRSHGWRVVYTPLLSTLSAVAPQHVAAVQPAARAGRGLGPILAGARRFR
jgi:O-antigen biosynthesis protein